MNKEKKISDHRIFSDLSEEKRECVQENFDYILDEIKNWLKTNDEKYFFKLKKAGTNKERMFWYIMLRENVLNDFEAGKNVWIKIGKSKNVSKRKAQYDGADKWPMKLLATGHFLSVRDPNKFNRNKGELKWREIDCEVVIQRFLDQWAFDRHKNEWYLVNKAIVGKLISGFLLLDGHTLQDEESKTTVTRPDWIGELEKKVPDFILQDQDENRFVQEDYFTCSKGSVDLSATPDGVLPGGLLEVKCPDLGRSCFEKGFPEQYICQIVMQQMVVNNQDNGYDIDHTYFMGWTPWKYKLWVYERNLEFEQYVDDALKEYAEALVNGGEVRKKPKDYKKVLADAISKIKLIKKGE